MGRRRKGRDIHGVLLLDKPAGMSSNQAVQKVRWLFGARKAGHTGTLDPFATGLLPRGQGSELRGHPLVQKGEPDERPVAHARSLQGVVEPPLGEVVDFGSQLVALQG